MRIARDVKYPVELNNSPLSSVDAREQLQSMARNLIGRDGKIISGYLRLSEWSTGVMEAGGVFASGSRQMATSSIKLLLKQAYGSQLGLEAANKLTQAIDAYCRRSGGAIGTRSFVKMIQAIEIKLAKDDGQVPVVGGPQVIHSRIDLEAFEAAKTSRERLNDQLSSLRTELGSPISDASLAQFQNLYQLMKDTPRSFKAFIRVMFPSCSALNKTQVTQSVDQTRTFAMGDADGSMGRMVLHAIASGVAELPKPSLPALARLMKKEVEALSHERDEEIGMAQFQADPEVTQDLDEIAEALVIKPNPQDGKPACIYLGDILSDRFTNNQAAMATLIYKLSGIDPLNTHEQINTGVRFIAGNHDTRPLINRNGDEIYASQADRYKLQTGANAVKKLSWHEYQALLLNCFQAADFSAGVLTTHNGVVRGPGPDEYLVAVAMTSHQFADRLDAQGALVKGTSCIVADSPDQLAQRMNDAFRERIKLGFIHESVSTDFRANDEHMTPAALKFDHIPGFRQLHGHDASTNETHQGVTNLNARGAEGIALYLPVGLVID